MNPMNQPNNIEEVKNYASKWFDKGREYGNAPITKDMLSELEREGEQICQLFPQSLDDKELEETLLDTKIFLHDDVAYFDGAYFRLGKKGVKQLVALLQKTRKRRKEREVLKGSE